MTSHLEELESLLFDWEVGMLSHDGVQRVREILKSDDEARTWFVQQQMITAALKLEGDAGLLPVDSVNNPDEQTLEQTSDHACVDVPPRTVAAPNDSRRSPMWVRAFAAAMVLICIQAGRILYLESAGKGRQDVAEANVSDSDDTKEAMSRGIALVTRLVDVEWNADQVPLEVGDALTPGRLAMSSGFAQIEFFCGATVVVEGPAELELKSSTLARVHSGRLRAQVPPAARGFRVEVDDMTVVDLGTEFGLSVSPERADVQVFDGEVELHPGQQHKQNLTAGHAVSRAADGQLQTSKITPKQFVDIASLETHAYEQRAARYRRWRSYSDVLRQDSRLIAYYAFDEDEDWQRRFSNSVQPANPDLDGAIVGARHVDGRWPGKQALEFRRPGDRVRVDIPGEFDSLTFACWVKIDSLDRWFNSLFLTDGYNQGEPHWQILDSGQLYFSVRPTRQAEDGPRDHKVLSPSFWQPSMSGKWLHLATTYDAATGRTTHYLNGEVLHSEQIPEAQVATTTQIGAASIGNWASPTQPGAEFAIRNLNGQIDEFTIFAAALTAAEITEMYAHGKP